MLTIVLLLNLLTETFRKKLTDAFPVIVSTPHRETEFLLLMEPMFDFIIRHTLKNANTNDRIEKFALNTLNSFIQLLKYGFEDPTNMSYDTLHRKTSLILQEFFQWLKYINLREIESMYNPNTFYKRIKLAKRSDMTDEVLRMYPYDDHGWNGLYFSAKFNSQCICLDVGVHTFSQLCMEDEIDLFNLSEEIDSMCKMTDGSWATRNMIDDRCEFTIGDFPEMEDILSRAKSDRSTKRKLRKQRNAIMFH